MTTGGNNAEEEMWGEEDLALFVAVLHRIFEVIMTYRSHPRVKSIHPVDGTHKAGSEHTYKPFVCTYEPDSETTFDDPTPPGYSDFRTQLVMTDKCDLFCALMEGIVREQGQALFGPAFSVQWVQYKSKPTSVLVTKDRVGKLKNHSVLRMTLSQDQVYIFDGSSAQYGSNSVLVSKDEYEAKNAQSAADANWKHTGRKYPFVVMTHARKQDMEARKAYPYWKGILNRLTTFVDHLSWRDYRGRPADEVQRLVFTSAYETFAETQNGADTVQV